LVFFANGFIDGSGSATVQGSVPNDASLVKAQIHFQSAFLDLPTLTAVLGNSDCFAIVP
jgi:hypothetical protein